MIPEGKYRGRGIETEAALTSSKEKGTPAVSVVVEIIDGEHAGQRLRWDGWLTDGAAQRTLESLRHMGWRGDMLDDLAGVGDNEVQVVIEHESNQEGKAFARIRWINRLGGASINEEAKMAKEAAKGLAQRFAAMARGTRSGPAAKPGAQAAQRPTTRREPTPDTFDEDSIPF